MRLLNLVLLNKIERNSSKYCINRKLRDFSRSFLFIYFLCKKKVL